MLKMSGDAIIEPFFTIFKNCLKRGIFPDDWKNGNIEPIFKKGNEVLIMDKSEYKKEMYIEKYSLNRANINRPENQDFHLQKFPTLMFHA